MLAVIVIVIAASYLFFELRGNWYNEKIYTDLLMEPEQSEEETAGEPVLRYSLEELKKVNPDCVGIIEVPGTGIYYPVVLSDKEDGFYYMNRNFYQEKDGRGSIFMDYRCDPEKPSTNLVFYGHRMRNNQMFAQLKQYKSKEFWKSHQIVYYTDENGTSQYQIFAAYLSGDPAGMDETQKKYQMEFIEGGLAEERNGFISAVKSWSYYDTGVTVDGEKTEEFITLRTCDYAVDNGRISVVAKLTGKMKD